MSPSGFFHFGPVVTGERWGETTPPPKSRARSHMDRPGRDPGRPVPPRSCLPRHRRARPPPLFPPALPNWPRGSVRPLSTSALTRRKARAGAGGSPGDWPPTLREFFDRFFGRRGELDPEESEGNEEFWGDGTGTGFLIGDRGENPDQSPRRRRDRPDPRRGSIGANGWTPA